VNFRRIEELSIRQRANKARRIVAGKSAVGGETKKAMGTSEILAERNVTSPLYNNQPLKFGLFAINANGSVFQTKVPSSFEVTWDHSVKIAQLADEIGIEVLVPITRWLGFGGETNHHNITFETVSYAAGLAAKTNNIMVVSTLIAPAMNPIVAAKAIATIDHISNGRVGLNLVMGWYAEEMAMMGITLRDHTKRYDYGAEWMTIVDRLWAEERPFDFHGDFFDLVNCQSLPKPVQRRPVVINAGGSPAGADFSARFADFNFTNFVTEEQARSYCSKIRDLARTKYDRDIGMLTMTVVVCRETEAEAKAAYQAIIDQGDWEAANNYIKGLSINPGAHEEHLRTEFVRKFVAGAGNHPLVGTPEQVAEGLQSIHDAGIDGVFLGLIDYANELPFLAERVFPLLQERGLRV
jgi:dimethylsulfone monooxygenase